ncbi:MAG: outer membrane beta-barrel family protein [Reichenbachiella sp.]|uniref:outer membrane beta-barrel family protein n=1 Tax=Reichenbachiella sp. TaxID=2184521 RepID=UPI0032972584
MKFYSSGLIVILFLLGGVIPLAAQQTPTEISGIVLESGGKQPIPFATVVLRDTQSKSPITSATTAQDGRFKLITDAPNFYLEISFLGFITQRLDNLSGTKGKIELGTVYLAEDSKVLNEVVVAGQKSTTEFKVDKRVFNVGNDLSSTGMGALELLNHVPSVNVNIEGEVSLRGSTGVQILIDGKPSILADEQSNALGTITADMIEKVEVITNPSAKYDAEGTSGILNIVLKKEEKKGMNGSISVNTGIPDNHSIGISLNRRTQKFNLFTQLGVGYRSLPRYSENSNRDLTNNTTVYSEGDAYRNETFYNIILGADYHINELNVLTLSGNFAYEVEDQPSETYFDYLDASNTITSQWQREENTEATNPKWQYELQYKKDFEDHKDHQLLFSALGRFFGKDQSSDFINTTTLGSVQYSDQLTRTKFQQADYTFKLDYVDPITEQFTLETGAQLVINDVGNDYEVQDLVGSEFVTNPNLTNNFEYDQKVLAVYVTSAYEFDKLGVKLGLRLENTQLNTLLTNTNERNNQEYTNLFPSAHASYKFSENFSLQAGYSRRIYRPRLWDLNPFFNIRDNFNIRTGNPNLLPQFTDSYEVTNIFIMGKLALNTGIYHRYTTDVKELVVAFENNVRTTMPMNIGTDRTTGIEINAEYDLASWISANADFNYNSYKRVGSLESQVFDFEGTLSTARLTTKLKLSADLEMELTGNYNSGFPTVQSELSSTTFMDFGLRKKFLDSKVVVNVGVRDVFASRIQERYTTQTAFELYSFGQRGRFITLGFSYGFGKGEAMTYSGRRRR